LIEEFLRETDSGIDFESLRETSFSPTEAAMMLETSYLRRLFIKVAVALVKADGTFSDAERHAIGEIADAFGLSNADFGDLEQQASRVSLE
jgi:tellurite resistance protein